MSAEIVMTKHASERWDLRFACSPVDEQLKTAKRLNSNQLKKLEIPKKPNRIYLQTECGAILVCRVKETKRTVALTVLSPEYAALNADGKHKKRRKRIGVRRS